ncbi:MAG TPA: hypothetical protein VG759_29345 [Candidatus Angelobacter sp.]|jgi:hypothetical protein|nr:hypothetical protein [Candidatus Angelobacter sp.]
MRINPSFPRRSGRDGSQRGTALMEFLFALPFLFFILILTVNFGKAFLMRQRAVMAVRYVAFADVHRQPLPTDSQVSQLFFRGEQVQVLSSSSGSQEMAKTVALIPDRSGLSGLMNSMSGTKGYQVQHTYHPVFALGDYWGDGLDDWFPAVTVSSTLTMDSRDWRHDEMSFGQLLRNVIGGGLGPLGF